MLFLIWIFARFFLRIRWDLGTYFCLMLCLLLFCIVSSCGFTWKENFAWGCDTLMFLGAVNGQSNASRLLWQRWTGTSRNSRCLSHTCHYLCIRFCTSSSSPCPELAWSRSQILAERAVEPQADGDLTHRPGADPKAPSPRLWPFTQRNSSSVTYYSR